MKIVNIIGGLGNQMFQGAFAIALLFRGEETKLDTSHFDGYGLHNGFELTNVFPNYPIGLADKTDLKRVTRFIPNYRWSRIVRKVLPKLKTEFLQPYYRAYIFEPEVLGIKGDCYLEGYWMSPLYFKDCRDAIMHAYSFKPFETEQNMAYERQLLADNSVTIHIRRGDYVGAESFKDICTLTYYRNAIVESKKVTENPVFYIFSNDQQWCMDNLKQEFGNSEVHFVTNNKGMESYRDMQLMTLARCNIVANSSFSWWGAYLNKRTDHIVFCPNKWVNGMEHKDHYVDGWIKLDTK